MHYAQQVWIRDAKEDGIAEGRKEERQKGIGLFIDGCRGLGVASEAIVAKLMELYHLSSDEARAMVMSRLG